MQLPKLFTRVLLLLLLVLPVASFVGKTPVYAQGNLVCFRNGWGQGGIEITDPGTVPSSISPNTTITYVIKFKALRDVPHWGEAARNYRIKGSSEGNPDVYANISSLTLINSDTYQATFTLPGSTFAQLTDDQPTGYALNLASDRDGGCILGGYAVTQDGQPPAATCTLRNQGACGVTAGCDEHEACSVASDGATPVCRKIAGSCGYLSCGQQGNPATTACGCTGGSFVQIGAASPNYCCGWIENGQCVGTQPAAYAACGTIFERNANLRCRLPSTTDSSDIKEIQSGFSRCMSDPSTCCTEKAFCQDSPNTCGTIQTSPAGTKTCEISGKSFPIGASSGLNPCANSGIFCCLSETACELAITNSTGTGGNTEEPEQGSLLDAIKGPTNDTFNALNPLNIAAGKPGESARSPFFSQLQTPGGIISRVLIFAFPIAGIILFLMIVWGGFEMVTGATNAKSMDAGRQRITGAVVGFILLFSSYWLMQIIEAVFGLAIL